MATFEYPIAFYYTRDLATTADFYETKLGLTLHRDQGDCRIYRINPGAYIGFCERETVEPTGNIICLITDNVDAWYEKLTLLGVAFEKQPAINPRYNIYHCFLRDPNGYLLEIQTFLDDA
jgi:catechol 2,3-dioxygenase-like lactoylglutathione lyase family enzyme